MAERRPDYDFVKDLRRELEDNVWKRAHRNWIKTEQILGQELEVRRKAGTPTYHSPTASNKIQGMVDTLITSEPTVTVEPRNESQAAKDVADRLEKAFKAILVGSAHKAISPPFKQGASNLAAFGYASFANRINMKHFPEKVAGFNRRGKAYKKAVSDREQSRKLEMPFWVEAPHPSWVLMLPWEKEPPFALEIQTKKAWDLERDWGYEHDGKPWDDLECLFYTSKEWRAIFVKDTELLVVPNEWGFVPFVQILAGFGSPTAYGLGNMTSGRQGDTIVGTNGYGYRAEDLTVGLLDKIHSPLRERDTLLTALSRLAFRGAYPERFTIDNPADIATQEAGGDMIQVSSLDSIKWEDVPQVANSFALALEKIERDIDEGTFTSEVTGGRTTGVETARQHAMMLVAARLRFGTSMAQLNYAGGIMLKQIAMAIEKLEEPAYVGKYVIKPEDIGGNYEYGVDFAAGDEETKARRAQMGMELFKAGVISQEDLLQKYVGETDVSGAMEKVFVEQGLKSPEIQKRVMAVVDALLMQKYPGLAAEQAAAPGQETPPGTISQPMNPMMPGAGGMPVG